MKFIFLIYFLAFLSFFSNQIANQNIFSKKKLKNANHRYPFYQLQFELTDKMENTRRLDLARELAQQENKMKLEQEKRERIFRQYLACRVHSSFIRDFHTRRF